MPDNIYIPAVTSSSGKKLGRIFFLLLVCIIAGTALRVSLLFIYPVIVLMMAWYFRMRVTAAALILFGLAMLSFLLSLYPHLFLKYKLLSLYYVLPFLLLLFAQPTRENDNSNSPYRLFFSCLSAVALLNDLIGFVQVIRTPDSDDSFLGLYSQYSISLNGLMLINTVLFFYYFTRYIEERRTIFLFAFIFFGLCANLGFYGAGLIVSMLAFVLAFFRFTVKAVVTTAVASILTLVIVYFSMLLIKPVALQYNVENIQKIMRLDLETGPRKLISFYNYGKEYPRNAKDFLFGSGPGTYISRSAFMVGSPSYFTGLPFIKDSDQPYYFKNFGYSLWNEKNTIKELYLDGFRNQPFSSALAFLGEYGLLFTLMFFLLYFGYFSGINKQYKTVRGTPGTMSPYRTFKFLMIMLPLLMIIDNFVDYPEVMLILLPAIKFAHAELLNRSTENEPVNEHS